jgi:hypothetical protein
MYSDDFVPGGPAVRVTYRGDGTVAFVDQTAGSSDATMGAVILGALAIGLVAGAAPGALIAHYGFGVAWGKSALIGLGAAIGLSAISMAVERSRAPALPAAAPQAAPTQAPVTASAPASAASAAAATGPATGTAPVLGLSTEVPPSPVTGLQMQAGPAPATLTYNGVVITLTAPAPVVRGSGIQPMFYRLPLWTATFTLPGASASQSTTGVDPATALSAAQTAIDAALNPPAPAAPITSLPVAVSFYTPSAPAPAPQPVAVMKLPQKPALAPVTYRGVAISFAYSGGKYVASFTPPGNLLPYSTPPQSSYAGALAAAQGTIDQDIMASGG